MCCGSSPDPLDDLAKCQCFVCMEFKMSRLLLRQRHQLNGCFGGRRSLQRKALDEHPGWPAIPMASMIEQMTVRRKPLGSFAPNSPPAKDFAALWTTVERLLRGG